MIPFDPQLLSIADEEAEIIARTCRACSSTTLVTNPRCAICSEPTESVPIRGGTVLYVCEAQFPVHGLTPPVQIAQVRCEPEIDIVGVCVDPLKIGDEVELEPIAVRNRDGESGGYAFRSAQPYGAGEHAGKAGVERSGPDNG